MTGADITLTADGGGGVEGGGSNLAHVESNDPYLFSRGKKNELRIPISVRDADGSAVSGATVTLDLATPGGLAQGSATSNSEGNVTFRLSGKPADGSYTSTVTVSGGGLTFELCTEADGTMDESEVTFDIVNGSLVNEVVVDECAS